MSALIFVTALAAQAVAPVGSAPVPASSGGEGSSIGAYTYADLEAGAGYSTNPNFAFGDNTGSGFGRVSVHGVHTRVSDRTTTVISAFAQDTFYTRHYGSQQSFDLNARHDARVNEHLSIFGDADFAYDKGGQLDTRIISVPNVPLPPGAIEPPVLITPGGDFLSITGRHYSASGHIGAQLALSAREFLTASTGIDHVVFKSAGLDTHFTTIPVTLGYNRQLNSRTSVGAQVSTQFTDYNGPANTRIVTPQLTFQTLLAEHLTFSGAVGASFASVDDGINTRHSTGVAANASLCSVGEQSRFCARAAIDQQAATVAGPARNVSLGVDYSRRLDADQTIQFSLNANRYSSPIAVVSGTSFSHATYFRGAADYTRRLSSRWFGGASVAARKVAQSGPDPKSDISGSLFIRYRLGDLR